MRFGPSSADRLFAAGSAPGAVCAPSDACNPADAGSIVIDTAASATPAKHRRPARWALAVSLLIHAQAYALIIVASWWPWPIGVAPRPLPVEAGRASTLQVALIASMADTAAPPIELSVAPPAAEPPAAEPADWTPPRQPPPSAPPGQAPSPDMAEPPSTVAPLPHNAAPRRGDDAELAAAPPAEPLRRKRPPTATPEPTEVDAVAPGQSNAPQSIASTASDAVEGSDTELPRVAINPPPPYPADALAARVGGRVRLQVRVGADGRVQAARVIESSGHASLDRAALETVRGWQFTPARSGGLPIPSDIIIPIRFTLAR